MTETTEIANPCEECGRPAPVLNIAGAEIALRYCQECAVVVAAAEAYRERIASQEAALRRAGGTPRLLEQSLAGHPNDGARCSAVEWISAYGAGAGGNLWLSGPLGTGKTGLAWGIVRALVEAAVDHYWEIDEEYRALEPPLPGMIVRWADLLDELKAAFDADRRAQANGDVADPSILLERAKRVPVLALDDLGRERPTPYALEKLATLVEARYQRLIPTIVTSNYGPRDLATRLSDDAGTDAVSGPRIVSRLIEGATRFEFEGKSLRRGA